MSNILGWILIVLINAVAAYGNYRLGDKFWSYFSSVITGAALMGLLYAVMEYI